MFKKQNIGGIVACNAVRLRAIPSAGVFRPTVIDKRWPIESMGSRPRDHTHTFDSGVRARSSSRRTPPAEGIAGMNIQISGKLVTQLLLLSNLKAWGMSAPSLMRAQLCL